MNNERGEREHHTGQSSGVPLKLENNIKLLYVRDDETIQPFGA